jgi:hypothetical protein
MRIFQKMAVESPAFLADPDLTGTVLFTKQSFILACTENNNNIQNTIFYG